MLNFYFPFSCIHLLPTPCFQNLCKQAGLSHLNTLPGTQRKAGAMVYWSVYFTQTMYAPQQLASYSLTMGCLSGLDFQKRESGGCMFTSSSCHHQNADVRQAKMPCRLDIYGQRVGFGPSSLTLQPTLISDISGVHL